jgi:transposase
MKSPNGYPDIESACHKEGLCEEGREMGGGFVGIDVSKDPVDVPSGLVAKTCKSLLTIGGIGRLARTLQGLRPELVVLEASGGYEALLLERLFAKQIPVALLNPRHVRQFARASGRLA